MNEQAIEVVSKSSAATTWFGALFGLLQGMDKNDVAMWVGIFIAFVGMAINSGVNWYYKRKDHKLALRIAGLKDEE